MKVTLSICLCSALIATMGLGAEDDCRNSARKAFDEAEKACPAETKKVCLKQARKNYSQALIKCPPGAGKTIQQPAAALPKPDAKGYLTLKDNLATFSVPVPPDAAIEEARLGDINGNVRYQVPLAGSTNAAKAKSLNTLIALLAAKKASFMYEFRDEKGQSHPKKDFKLSFSLVKPKSKSEESWVTIQSTFPIKNLPAEVTPGTAAIQVMFKGKMVRGKATPDADAPPAIVRITTAIEREYIVP